MKQYNILFLCTHNSARSVLGEALASTHPSGLFVGYSDWYLAMMFPKKLNKFNDL